MDLIKKGLCEVLDRWPDILINFRVKVGLIDVIVFAHTGDSPANPFVFIIFPVVVISLHSEPDASDL